MLNIFSSHFVRIISLSVEKSLKPPLNGLAPDYLQDLISIRTTKYNIRNLEMKLNLPKPNTNYLKRSLTYSVASLWNNLPNNLRTIKSLRSFKREVNRFMKMRVRLPHSKLVKQYFYYYSRYRMLLYYCYYIFTEGFTVFK